MGPTKSLTTLAGFSLRVAMGCSTRRVELGIPKQTDLTTGPLEFSGAREHVSFRCRVSPCEVFSRCLQKSWKSLLGGGFKYFLFSPLPGEMIQFDYYFSDGLNPPTRLNGTHFVGIKQYFECMGVLRDFP